MLLEAIPLNITFKSTFIKTVDERFFVKQKTVISVLISTNCILLKSYLQNATNFAFLASGLEGPFLDQKVPKRRLASRSQKFNLGVFC